MGWWVTKDPSDKATLEARPKGSKGNHPGEDMGAKFLAEGTAKAQVLRSEQAQCVQKTDECGWRVVGEMRSQGELCRPRQRGGVCM